MGLYDAAAYAPKFTSSSGTFLFVDSDTTRKADAVITDMNVSHSYTTETYKVPGVSGNLIQSNTPNGMTIPLTIEITTLTLEDWLDRKQDLLSALEGDAQGKFDFYLRYVDSSNYWLYPDCAVQSIELREFQQDPKNPREGLETISLTLFSEQVTPSIKEGGTFVSGSTDVTVESANWTGAAVILIENHLIVQNSTGDIKFDMNAITGDLSVVGAVIET